MICAGSNLEDRRLPTARHAGPRVSRVHCGWLESCPSHLWTRCDVVLRIVVPSDRSGIGHLITRGVVGQSPRRVPERLGGAISDSCSIAELISVNPPRSVVWAQHDSRGYLFIPRCFRSFTVVSRVVTVVPPVIVRHRFPAGKYTARQAGHINIDPAPRACFVLLLFVPGSPADTEKTVLRSL